MLIPSRNRPIWQMCKIFTFHDSSRAYTIQESRNVISYCSIPGIFVPSWSRPIWQINKRFTFLDSSRVYTIQESRNHIARFKKCWYHPGFDQYDKYTRDLHSSTLPGHIQFKNLGMFLHPLFHNSIGGRDMYEMESILLGCIVYSHKTFGHRI